MDIKEYAQMMKYLTRPQEPAIGGRIGFAKAGFVFGDQTFNVDIPNMTPVQSKSFQKGLKDLEKWSQNPNAENWIKTFRTPSAKGQTHQSDFSLNLRKYLQGQPVKARAKELFDSVNIKELLGDKVKDIQTYTPQEFRKISNLPKSEKAAKVAMAKSAKAANAVRDVFVRDVDADLEDVARGIFGKDFDNASVVVQEDMLSKASDDTAKLLEALSANRPVPGFKPIAADKMGDIIQNIEDNTKDFKFREGTIREYRFRVRDSLLGLKTESEQGFRNLRNVVGGTDKGKVVDEVFGLSATFKNAPGYVENVQLIDKKINNIKGKQIDKPFSAIVNAVKNKKDIVQYEGKETNISEAIKKFNAKSKEFSNVNKISTPQIFVGDNLDATKLLSNFDKYSPQAQKDILKNAKEGFVLNSTSPSTPAGTFKPTKPVVLGSTFANVDKEMLDFRKLPGDLKNITRSTIEAAQAAGKSPAVIGTKTGRKILGNALNLGFGPTSMLGLTYGLRPEDGYDLSRAGDRLGFEAEAAFAKPLVEGTLSVTDKIKNPLARKAAERASLAGLSPAMALRLARVATPLGLASLGLEGVYHLGKYAKNRRAELAAMSPEEKDELRRQSDDFSFGEYSGAANGGLMNLTGGGITSLNVKKK